MTEILIGFQTATPKAAQVAEQVAQLFKACGYEFSSETTRKIELVLVPSLMQEFTYEENEHSQLLAKTRRDCFMAQFSWFYMNFLTKSGVYSYHK